MIVDFSHHQKQRTRVSLSYGRVRVLIVEDDAAALSEIKDAVLDAGALVFAVGSAEEALPFLNGPKFDVAFIDYHLPGATGLEFAGTLKRLMPGSRVVLMSADQQAVRLSNTFDPGVFTVVDKPLPNFAVNRFVKELGKRG